MPHPASSRTQSSLPGSRGSTTAAQVDSYNHGQPLPSHSCLRSCLALSNNDELALSADQYLYLPFARISQEPFCYSSLSHIPTSSSSSSSSVSSCLVVWLRTDPGRSCTGLAFSQPTLRIACLDPAFTFSKLASVWSVSFIQHHHPVSSAACC